MKKWIFATMMVAIVISCRKNSGCLPIDEGDHRGNELLTELLSKDISSQRVMFGMLKAEDRKAVWAEHLSVFLTRGQLSAEQIHLVNELKDLNKASYYETGTDAQAIGTAVVFKHWIDKAQEVFSKEQIYQLAFSLNDLPKEIDYAKSSFIHVDRIDGKGDILGQLQKDPDRSTTNDESLPDCGCRVGATFTCPYTIYPTTPGGFPSVAFGTCTFRGAAPCDVEGGCGFMGWSLCDGNVCTNSFS